MKDNKTKIYRLKSVDRPKVAVVLINADEIKNKQREFDALIEALWNMEGQEIPSRKDIVKAEICLYYAKGEEDWISR